jgi:hypothetical protein
MLLCHSQPGIWVPTHAANTTSRVEDKDNEVEIEGTPRVEDKGDEVEMEELDPVDPYIMEARQKWSWSWREIREGGGYKVAESTLRGRFRRWTKAGSARVRKPRWTTEDVGQACLG